MIPRETEEFVDVGFVHQVPARGPFFVTAGAREVILARHGDEIVAFGGSCTHNFARLRDGKVEGEIVICPLHGARYNVTTGASLSALCRALPRLPVRIVGRRVQVKA